MNYLKTYFFDIIFKNYFNCAGRASRKQFWLFTLNSSILFFSLLIIYLGVLLFTLANLKYHIANPDSIGNFSRIPLIINYILLFFLIADIVLLSFPYLNLVGRRLHDINFSAWWLLLFLVPQIGSIVIFIFMCLPGTKGKNKYDVEEGKKKFGYASLLIILAFLVEITFAFLFARYLYNKMNNEGELLINKIAQAELKYFEQHKDFLYIDKTDSNDILDINIKDSFFFTGFSCTTITNEIDKLLLANKDKNNKFVEIQVWEKSSKQDNRFGRERYMYTILDNTGTKTRLLKQSYYKNLNSSTND